MNSIAFLFLFLYISHNNKAVNLSMELCNEEDLDEQVVDSLVVDKLIDDD